MENQLYDVIIVGSGPAGLTAALYTTRANLKTVIIAGLKWGGQLQLTTDVENFPGFPDGIQGPDLMMAMRKQAEKFGAEFVNADMDPADFSTPPAGRSGGPFTVVSDGKTFIGKALLIATGADAKTLGVLGEKELTGRGISYCATCDGAFFRNKQVIVVGGGDSAMEEACFLTNFAAKVTIVHRRDSFKASQIMIDKAKKNPKIALLLNSQIVEVSGNGHVEKVKIKTTSTVIPAPFGPELMAEGKAGTYPAAGSANSQQAGSGQRGSPIRSGVTREGEKTYDMPIDGVFVAIGHTPNTKIFGGVELREGGYVRTQNGTRTNITGIFVSGDVEDDRYRQAIVAAGFGCMAALDIDKWLRDKS